MSKSVSKSRLDLESNNKKCASKCIEIFYEIDDILSLNV